METQKYDWHNGLDERQQKEVHLALVYAYELDSKGNPVFSHGTDGHNRLLLIAKMATLLNEQERQAKGYGV